MTDRSDLTQQIVSVLCDHVYGDRGPVAGHPEALSVCTRAAEDLCSRFLVSSQPDIDKVAEAIFMSGLRSDFIWTELSSLRRNQYRRMARAAVEAIAG